MTFHSKVSHPRGHFWWIWKCDSQRDGERKATEQGAGVEAAEYEEEMGKMSRRHWEFDLKVYWIMYGWGGGER